MIETLYQHFTKAYQVTTDSRKVGKDAVFFALKGENFDANDFALQVAEAGMASLVVADRKDLPKHERILIVVRRALKGMDRGRKRVKPGLMNVLLPGLIAILPDGLINVLWRKWKR